MGVTKISLRLIGALIIAIAVIAGCEADSPNHPIASDSGTYDGQLLMVKKSDGPIGHISPTSLTDDSLLALINQNPPLSSSALRDILIAESPLSDTVLIAAIERSSPMVSSHIKDVLLTNSPLSRTVLQSVCYNSGMSSSDNEAVLIASSPLPCSILELVIAGFPPMDAIHLLSVLGAQGSACVSDSSWTITIPVTPSGATLNLLNSSLVVPPGAVNATTDLTFTIMASMPQDLPNALGRIFEFGPDGTVFQVPITLSLAFSDAGHSGRSRELYNIRFYYFDEINDTWMPEQDPQIDWANRRLIVELSHFSRYAFAR